MPAVSLEPSGSPVYVCTHGRSLVRACTQQDREERRTSGRHVCIVVSGHNDELVYAARSTQQVAGT